MENRPLARPLTLLTKSQLDLIEDSYRARRGVKDALQICDGNACWVKQ